MLRLQPEETFRPHSLWRLPLLGSHDYRLPQTIDRAARRSRPTRARSSPRAGRGGRVRDRRQRGRTRQRRRARTSSPTRRARRHPETMAQAVLASAAVSALVLPRRVDDRIATDGAWVRNFPLGHAYRQAGRRADRQLPVPAEVSAAQHRLARAAAPPARALPEDPADSRADHRAARGGGARRARRACALGRHDRATDARHRAAEHDARRADGARQGRGARGARRAPRGRRRDRASRRRPARRRIADAVDERFATARVPVPRRPADPAHRRAGERRRDLARDRAAQAAAVARRGEARADRTRLRAARRGARRRANAPGLGAARPCRDS